jgi:hypothetical protein
MGAVLTLRVWANKLLEFLLARNRRHCPEQVNLFAIMTQVRCIFVKVCAAAESES